MTCLECVRLCVIVFHPCSLVLGTCGNISNTLLGVFCESIISIIVSGVLVVVFSEVDFVLVGSVLVWGGVVIVVLGWLVGLVRVNFGFVVVMVVTAVVLGCVGWVVGVNFGSVVVLFVSVSVVVVVGGVVVGGFALLLVCVGEGGSGISVGRGVSWCCAGSGVVVFWVWVVCCRWFLA